MMRSHPLVYLVRDERAVRRAGEADAHALPADARRGERDARVLELLLDDLAWYITLQFITLRFITLH